MAALVTGKLAPDFTLPTLDGKKLSLHELLQHGPVVLAFFKISCPVCQYAFPMYERLAKAHKDAGATFLGISQNGAADAKAFAREYGVTFPDRDRQRRQPLRCLQRLRNHECPHAVLYRSERRN